MEYSTIGIILIACISFLVLHFKEEAEKKSFLITETSIFNLKDLEGLGDLLLACWVQAFASYDSARIHKDKQAKKDLVLLFDAVAHGYIFACLTDVPDIPDRDSKHTNTAFGYYKTAMGEHGVGDYGGAGGFEERKDYLIERGESPAVFDAIEYGFAKRVNRLIEIIEEMNDKKQTKAYGKYLTFDQYIDAFSKEHGNLISFKLNSSYQEILSK